MSRRSINKIRTLTREEQITKWYDWRQEYNRAAMKPNRKSLPGCVFCKNIYGRTRQDDRGKGCTFTRDTDGTFIGICGGNSKRGSCDGMKIPPADYIDSATLRKELHSAKGELMRELKHVRDRVFGTEHLTKEDDDEFKALTREYTGIRKMEEQYKLNLDSIPFEGTAYAVEDTRPETEGGTNVERMKFRSNKLLVQVGEKLENMEIGDMVLEVICKEDLPVRI